MALTAAEKQQRYRDRIKSLPGSLPRVVTNRIVTALPTPAVTVETVTALPVVTAPEVVTVTEALPLPLPTEEEEEIMPVTKEVRGGFGNSDSVLSGSLASPKPPGGGEPEERGNEENTTESRGHV